MTRMALPGPVGLLERELERAHLQRAIDHSREGVGRIAVIEGPAGIGKTTLLRSARELAREAGMNVCTARGAELEQEFPFGVVRQLFDAVLAAASEGARAEWLAGAAGLAAPLFDTEGLLWPAGRDQSLYPLLHGLYWLCSNLAAAQPLALLIDDAQWADEPSLSFLGFIARRLEELSILLVVAARPVDPGANGPLLTLLADPSVRLLQPRALSVEGTARLLASELGATVEDGFARACRDATAGNPFLLRELTHELRERDLAPVTANAGAVEVLVPRRVADAVLARLARVSDAAPPLAEAVAVLGDGTALRDAAALAGLDEPTAIDAAAALRNGDLFVDRVQLGFAHPIIRTAIYQSVLPAARALRHAAAARLLRERGAPAEKVAAQILLADALHEPWVVEQLQQAAASALALGAPRAAVGYLRRALELHPDPATRRELITQLGRAELLAGLADGPGHLGEALRSAEDPDERARLAIALAQVLKFTGRARDVVELLEGIEPPPDRAVADRVHVELLSAGLISQTAHGLIADRLAAVPDRGTAAGTAREHFELIVLAFHRMLDNRPRDEVLDLLARAGPHPPRGDEQIVLPPGPFTRGVVLMYYDELDAAQALYSGLIERARKRGALVPLVLVLGMRAEIAYRRGDLGRALADATEAFALARDVAATSTILLLRPMGVINSVAAEQERSHAELEELLARTDANLDDDTHARSFTLMSRALILLADGQERRALDQLLAFEAMPYTSGARAPAYVAWRSEAALVLHRLGDREAAQRLARAELELARAAGAPRAVGIALRACGLVEAPPAVDRLREAAEVLERSPARLEYARALVDLGACLRRGGERAAARRALREGQELALRCGATRLSRRAHDEIAATGARSAAPGLTGVASLTPSERRVADLAAGGRTNREIAQALFVSEKTVETHLGHVYDKLGVRSRHRLRDVLDSEAVESA